MQYVGSRSLLASKRRDRFDKELSVRIEDIEFEFRGFEEVPWSPFWLNPRRLRGSDFLMRWSQGQWSEDRMIHAVNQSDNFFALMYGPSSVAPDSSVREFELYFERLEAAGLSNMKRPDLLIFRKSDQQTVINAVEMLGGVEELPFTSEAGPQMALLLDRAIIAVECENSLWVAQQMPNFGENLRPMRRLDGKPGLPKRAKVPTIIVKEEDRGRLQDWQQDRAVDIHVWHGFYDLAFGIALDAIDNLIEEGLVEPRKYTYQSAGGSTTEKVIYQVYYHYAYPLAESVEEPELVAEHINRQEWSHPSLRAF